MRKIELTDEELLNLDGRVNSEAQLIVDYVKDIHKFSDIGNILYAEIIANSLKSGELKWRYKELSSCKNCDAKKSYVKYKSGINKGKNNSDKPIYVYGISFNEGIISFKGYAEFGFCNKCQDKVLDILINYIIKNNLLIEIQDKTKTIYIKETKEICYKCNKEIWLFDMGLVHTMMGDGYYYGACSYCGTKSICFGTQHKTGEGFRLVKKSELIQEKNCFQRKAEESNINLESVKQ